MTRRRRPHREPVQDFAKYTGRLAKASAAGERIAELLDHEPEVRDSPGARPAPPLRGAVHFEGVGFGYDGGRRVLSGLDLELAPGERVAVVGESGAGKSTLAALLLRLYDPQEGGVRIDGQDVREYTLASLRTQVGVVLQEPLLFAVSVGENIAFGAPGATLAAVESAARLARAHEFIAALPNGYETVLGERGVTLSGGQRQRLAIARAAVRGAPILVLDEPTTGLDEENRQLVLDALARLCEGRTTLWITHDLEAARLADRVVLLAGGRVVEQGSHADLVARDGRYAALVRLRQAQGTGQWRRLRALA